MTMKDRLKVARKELRRVLLLEATHDTLSPHFDFEEPPETNDPLVRLRKSLRRVERILDRRVK